VSPLIVGGRWAGGSERAYRVLQKDTGVGNSSLPGGTGVKALGECVVVLQYEYEIQAGGGWVPLLLCSAVLPTISIEASTDFNHTTNWYIKRCFWKLLFLW
jgi:hypothetical protein